MNNTVGSFPPGKKASFPFTIREEDVQAFAAVSGDRNPLHMENVYAGETEFAGRIVHGMFLAALVS
ncbi:MAG: MaoC/PaaZ C-terminal domain-containing protein, partial [Candidatus Levyibacteriota bacterium]